MDFFIKIGFRAERTLTACICWTTFRFSLIAEVVRTRMREENAVTKGFLPTLKFILQGEGFWALYRGLTLQVC